MYKGDFPGRERLPVHDAVHFDSDSVPSNDSPGFRRASTPQHVVGDSGWLLLPHVATIRENSRHFLSQNSLFTRLVTILRCCLALGSSSGLLYLSMKALYCWRESQCNSLCSGDTELTFRDCAARTGSVINRTFYLQGG